MPTLQGLIESARSDRKVFPILADYLEEIGDPRADLLRSESVSFQELFPSKEKVQISISNVRYIRKRTCSANDSISYAISILERVGRIHEANLIKSGKFRVTHSLQVVALEAEDRGHPKHREFSKRVREASNQQGTSYPIEIISGEDPPRLEGNGHYFTWTPNPNGTRVRTNRGRSLWRTYYHASTYHITVGLGWLIERDLL